MTRDWPRGPVVTLWQAEFKYAQVTKVPPVKPTKHNSQPWGSSQAPIYKEFGAQGKGVWD